MSSDPTGGDLRIIVSTSSPWGVAVHVGKVHLGFSATKKLLSINKSGGIIGSVDVAGSIRHLTAVTGNVPNISRSNPCERQRCGFEWLICVLTVTSYRCLRIATR